MSCKARLFVETICLPYYSIEPVQQQRDIPEENFLNAPPPNDQRAYDFVQDGASHPNVYAEVHKQPRQAPVEPDESHEYQAFDEMPTSSAADSTQHYAVMNNHTNMGNAPAYDELNRKI